MCQSSFHYRRYSFHDGNGAKVDVVNESCSLNSESPSPPSIPIEGAAASHEGLNAHHTGFKSESKNNITRTHHFESSMQAWNHENSDFCRESAE